MSPKRYQVRKPDGNAGALDEHASFLGFSVARLDIVGDDVPDRVFGMLGIDRFVEYKNPQSERGRKGRSEGQKRFANNWLGAPVFVAATRRDIDELLDWFKLEAFRRRS